MCLSNDMHWQEGCGPHAVETQDEGAEERLKVWWGTLPYPIITLDKSAMRPSVQVRTSTSLTGHMISSGVCHMRLQQQVCISGGLCCDKRHASVST